MNTQPLIGFHGTEANATVKCGSCTACCRRELVLLVDGDDATLYPEAQIVPIENPLTGAPTSIVIPHSEDGACVYLGPKGCMIYDKRPKMCRVFSCVGFVERVLEETTRAERRRDLKSGELDAEIWRAGMARRLPA